MMQREKNIAATIVACYDILKHIYMGSDTKMVLLAHGDTPWLEHYSAAGGIVLLAIGLLLTALVIFQIVKK